MFDIRIKITVCSILNIIKIKRLTTLFMGVLFLSFLFRTNASYGIDDSKLLDEFVQANKYYSSIQFDAANIKQFWIDNSVSCKEDTINIILSNNQSVPFKLQLINVYESYDCKIEVITDNSDLSFSVLDSKEKTLSKSEKEKDFIQYHIFSSLFHLEKTPDNIFYLRFASKTSDVLRLKKIVLSFSHNPNSLFHSTPGKLQLSKDNLSFERSKATNIDNGNDFSVTGKLSIILSRHKIILSNNTLHVIAKIKNTGNNETSVSLGFGCYNKNGTWLNYNHYPYKNIHKVLTVLSGDKLSSTITVDSYQEWRKGNFLALDAKEDMSDVPNENLLPCRITDVKELENGHAVITLDKPLDRELNGLRIRINSSGPGYLSTATKTLKPGEETMIETTIRKDESLFEYSSKAFSRGVYYVVPVIMSYSIDQSLENSIRISDFTIEY